MHAAINKYDPSFEYLYKRSHYNGLNSTIQLIFKEEEAKELGQGWTDSFDNKFLDGRMTEKLYHFKVLELKMH